MEVKEEMSNSTDALYNLRITCSALWGHPSHLTLNCSFHQDTNTYLQASHLENMA